MRICLKFIGNGVDNEQSWGSCRNRRPCTLSMPICSGGPGFAVLCTTSLLWHDSFKGMIQRHCCSRYAKRERELIQVSMRSQATQKGRHRSSHHMTRLRLICGSEDDGDAARPSQSMDAVRRASGLRHSDITSAPVMKPLKQQTNARSRVIESRK